MCYLDVLRNDVFMGAVEEDYDGDVDDNDDDDDDDDDIVIASSEYDGKYLH